MTHPFHPLCGRDFEFVKRRRNWRAEHVYVYDEAGELRPLPVAWTDLAVPDPFVVVAGGRSALRLADLLELVELVARLTAHRPAAEVPGVQEITP